MLSILTILKFCHLAKSLTPFHTAWLIISNVFKNLSYWGSFKVRIVWQSVKLSLGIICHSQLNKTLCKQEPENLFTCLLFNIILNSVQLDRSSGKEDQTPSPMLEAIFLLGLISKNILWPGTILAKGKRKAVCEWNCGQIFISILTLYHTIPTFNDPGRLDVENIVGKGVLLFPQSFLSCHSEKPLSKQYLICHPQILRNWSSPTSCRSERS